MKKRMGILAALFLAAGLTACGGNTAGNEESVTQTQTAESADATRPQEDRAGNPITVPEEVDSIISLAPATTQILCDLPCG